MESRRDWVAGLEAAHVPARCVDVELAEPLTDLEFPGYRSVHALVRLHGVPVGVVSVPLLEGRCAASTMASTVIDRLAPALVRVAVRQTIEAPISTVPLDPERLVAAPPLPNGPLPGVTVAVCTRGRPDNLRGCLEALCRLDHPDTEVIVVDNSPAGDATQCVVRAYADRIRELRYVREPGPGLDRARNRAITSATRDIIAFTDDDVAVDPGWASAVARLFHTSPEAHAMTGLVMPLELETEAQLVFERYRGFGRGFERRWSSGGARHVQSIALEHGNTGRLGTGANMAFRRSALAAIGGFDPALDLGTVTNGGGDLDMFFRVIKAGGTLAYEPTAVVRHRHRREPEELREQIAHWGIAMRSYVERNRGIYPEERGPFTALIHWLLGAWHLRRLVWSLFNDDVPTTLILAEMRGLLTGRSYYGRACVAAAEVARAFGPSLPPPRAVTRRTRGVIRPPHEIVDRDIDLALPLAPLDNVRDAEAVRLRITLDGRPLSTTIIAHHGRSMGVARLGDIVARSAGAAIAGLPGGVRQGRDATRELAARLLAVLQARPDGFSGARDAVEARAPRAPGEPAATRALRMSVVVCTRERPEDLERCLGALTAQTVSGLDVIVVDNAPRTDRTRRVAESAGARYVLEPRAGLDRARNAGLAAARAPYIAFTDDDAVPAPDWAEIVLATLGEPGVAGMAGAMVALELETSAQRLFERYLDRMTRTRPRDERRVFVRPFPPSSAGQVGAGANMAFRRSAIEAVGPFDEAFDAGMATLSGGDTEMFSRMIAAGMRLVYEPRAVVRHRHRRTSRELRRQLFGYGVGVYAFWTHRVMRHGDRDALRYALGTLRFHVQRLRDALRREEGELPPRLVLAELAGSLWGPVAYAAARRHVARDAGSRVESREPPRTGSGDSVR